MKTAWEIIQKRNREAASKEMDEFVKSFSGTADDLAKSLVSIMVKHNALKPMCDRGEVNYHNIESINRRKRGCSLMIFDDLLHATGYQIKLVRKNA